MHASADEAFRPSLFHQANREIAEPRKPSPRNQPGDILRAYQAIAGDPKYKHFTNIPARIIRCLEYFRIDCDHQVIRKRLHAYYLFIGVVDNAIDSGNVEVGARVLDYLDAREPSFEEAAGYSSIRVVTEVLKTHIRDECSLLMVSKLKELYQEVMAERGATSIRRYIDRRRLVGSLTADLSFMLICPFLKTNDSRLRDLMKEVGAIGCLVDSLIDLSSDHRMGLLAFTPGLGDYRRLMSRTMRLGVRLSLKHPGLCLLFLQAIIDNIRDRLSRNQPYIEHCVVSDRKGHAASVA